MSLVFVLSLASIRLVSQSFFLSFFLSLSFFTLVQILDLLVPVVALERVCGRPGCHGKREKKKTWNEKK